MNTTKNVHPFFLAVFPFLFVLAHNAGQVIRNDLQFLFNSALATLLSVVVVWFTVNIIVKDKSKSALIVSLLLIMIFSYGHFDSLLESVWQEIQVENVEIGHRGVLLSVWFLVLGTGIYFVAKKLRDPSALVRAANVFSMVLVLMSALKVGGNMDSLLNMFRSFPELEAASDRTDGTEKKGSEFRDIYYIVMERYAAGSTLKSTYGFDNTRFLEDLEARGFYVADKSRANYPKTAQSLASSLNMKYINHLKEESKRPNDWRPIYRILNNHAVGGYLKAKGYRFVHIGGWWEPTRVNEYADISLNFIETSEIADVVWGTTVIYPVLDKLGISPSDRWKKYYYSENRRYEALKAVAEADVQTFVFAHMYTTHDPYVFDSSCDYLSEREEYALSVSQGYIGSLECANKKVLETVDGIVARYADDKLPIIVFQGDEGPFPTRYREDETGFDWKNTATEDELKQKYRILNAYYFPDGKDEQLYSQITPVNSFRLMFNQYFDEEYELLEDRSYAFINGRNIYELFDITETVEY